MKKRKNRTRPGKVSAQERAQRRKQRSWREARRGLFALVLTLSVVGVALAAFKHNYDISHDLSVVGKGIPTVVQIHDPGCPLCNQLRRNASAAIDPFDDRLLYRIADISTPEGRRLQRKHEVPHVTLLLFDGDGVLRNVINGVQSEELLRDRFERHLNRWGALQGKQDS